MSQTVEFEMNKQLKNYIVIVKNMSEDREKSFYDAYGKDALVFGYIMKQKIRYRSFQISKTLRKMKCFNEICKEKKKKERIFTAYSGVPSYKIQEIIREELNKKGCQEILCSALIPAELWKESGRWDVMGAEMMRLKDIEPNTPAKS